jgi:hypothetical protein
MDKEDYVVGRLGNRGNEIGVRIGLIKWKRQERKEIQELEEWRESEWGKGMGERGMKRRGEKRGRKGRRGREEGRV